MAQDGFHFSICQRTETTRVSILPLLGRKEDVDVSSRNSITKEEDFTFLNQTNINIKGVHTSCIEQRSEKGITSVHGYMPSSPTITIGISINGQEKIIETNNPNQQVKIHVVIPSRQKDIMIKEEKD